MRALLAPLVLLAACGGTGGGRCAERRTATPLDRTTVGTIAGAVGFSGAAPPMATLALGAEPACGAQHQGPVLAGDALVHDGKVENAFVYLKDGLGGRVFAVPGEPVTIDQQGCLYRPHVVGAHVCQPIVFTNSDAVLHNVHGTTAGSSPWNFSMGVQNSRRTITIEASEIMVQVRCDVHPWMRAWVGVVDHPYFAVTGPDGTFTLPDVPAGDYVVGCWHERFGTREARVTVGAGETARVPFTFTAGT